MVSLITYKCSQKREKSELAAIIYKGNVIERQMDGLERVLEK